MDRDVHPRRVMDVKLGGSIPKLAGRKQRRSLDTILAVSDQLVKIERPCPNMVISFFDEEYPPDVVKPGVVQIILGVRLGMNEASIIFYHQIS